MIIPGIIASRFTPQGDFESIATVSVGAGGSSSISFNSIPSTYQHLQLRWIGRTNRAGNASDTVTIALNSDSGANYSYHNLYGDGSAAGAGAGANTTIMYVGWVAGATALSNTFGVGVLDILDYANTNKYKTVRSLTGRENNGSGIVSIESNSWRSTSAVTSLTITSQFGGTYQQHSQFALYGIRG